MPRPERRSAEDPAERPDGQQDDPPRATVRRLDHVGIVVHDIEAGATYWVEHLGLRRLETADVLGGSIRMTYLAAGDTTLQLVEPREPGALLDHLERHGEGLHHVCFLVDDIPAALQHLGEEPLAPPYVGGRGANVCFIRTTPCQVLVELTEPGPEENEMTTVSPAAPGLAVAGSGKPLDQVVAE